jgi:methylphosphotriester-DNA--protein-cysteine methyltransferase
MQPNAPEQRIVLAGTSGEYREFRPRAELDAHFQCVWANTLALDSTERLAVVPDGCVDITCLDSEVLVAGPDVTVNVTPIRRGTVIGVRFRPGAAALWLGMPMSELVGTRRALGEFWGPIAREIGERVGDQPTNAARMNVLQAELSRRAMKVEQPALDLGFVFNALKTESGGRGMSIILDRLNIGPRTLHRRCVEAFGYGPKTLDRILRFQRFLRRVRESQKPRLSGLAFEAGYADQAHLTREVRRLSTLSPAEILSQLGHLS